MVPIHGAGVADGLRVPRDALRGRATTCARSCAATARSPPSARRGSSLQLGRGARRDPRAPATSTATSSRQNVMIDADGHVYLSDFGLAKHALATRRADDVGAVGRRARLRRARVPHAPQPREASTRAPTCTRSAGSSSTSCSPAGCRSSATPTTRSCGRTSSTSRRGRRRSGRACRPRSTRSSPGRWRRTPRTGSSRPATSAARRRPPSGQTRCPAGRPPRQRRWRRSRNATGLTPGVARRRRPRPPPCSLRGYARGGGGSPSGPWRRVRESPSSASGSCPTAAAGSALRRRRAARRRPRPPKPAARPAGARVGATIRDVGRRPRGVVVAGGAVWVLSIHEPRITRLDVHSGRSGGRAAVRRTRRGGHRRRRRHGVGGEAGDERHPRSRPRQRQAAPPVRDARTARADRRRAERALGRRARDGRRSGDRCSTTTARASGCSTGASSRTGSRRSRWAPARRGWRSRAQRQVVRVGAGRAGGTHAWLTEPASELAFGGAGHVWASVRERQLGRATTVAAGSQSPQLPSDAIRPGLRWLGGRVFVA